MSDNDTTNAELLLSDLVDNSADVLMRDGGLDQVKANQVARKVAEAMLERWGGQQIYFSRRLIIKLSDRDMDIYNKFTGNNAPELAQEYKCSVQWVYRIIKIVHKNEVAKRQVDMFPDAAAL